MKPKLTDEERLRRRRSRSADWKNRNQDRVKEYRKQRYDADVEAARERSRNWYAENREYAIAVSSERQLARFGLTLDNYKEILQKQGGGCAICGEKPESGDRRLCIDHNHKTLEVRGLLCIRCNIGLGQFLENHHLLWRASEYLNGASTRFKLPRPLDQNPRRKKKGRI